MKNLWADVGDGLEIFRATVADISRIGMCLSSLPTRFNGDAKQVKILVTGKDGRISMDVGLKWCADGGTKKSIGVEIQNAPWRWKEYVMDFEATHANL